MNSVKSSMPIEKEYQNLTDKTFSALLKTGKVSTGHRYSILGRNPYLIFRSKGNSITLEKSAGKKSYRGDPLFYLQKTINFYSTLKFPKNIFFPGGAIGCLSYDLKDLIETFSCQGIDELNLPEIYFFFFREFLIFDELEKKYIQIKIFLNNNKALPLPHTNQSSRPSLGKLTSNFNKQEYMKAIEEVRQHIIRGDIYQANIAQRFKVNFSGDSFLLFKKINAVNPAPMSAYLNCGNFNLISTSPERLLRKTGLTLESRPIKGTIQRGKTKLTDKKNKQKLLNSAKESAELSMIIDLMRNDLGKIASPGSVEVVEAKKLEKYSNVFHLAGVIKAKLAPKTTFTEIIKSCLPGGSVTGCPKLEAMKIIESIEKIKRGFYCGSIGYLGFNGDFDFNIAIRTFIEKSNCLYFSLGGGITYDSSPLAEYEETLHKGESMFKVLEEVFKGRERIYAFPTNIK
ncbi:MAG: anthranilate synthase component I family protein [Elusimicrobiota bacterium]